MDVVRIFFHNVILYFIHFLNINVFLFYLLYILRFELTDFFIITYAIGFFLHVACDSTIHIFYLWIFFSFLAINVAFCFILYILYIKRIRINLTNFAITTCLAKKKWSVWYGSVFISSFYHFLYYLHWKKTLKKSKWWPPLVFKLWSN